MLLIGLGRVFNATCTSFSKRCCASCSLYWSLSFIERSDGFKFVMVFVALRSRGHSSMTRSSKRTRLSQRYTAREFRPYVTALGQLALAWNDLQESLAGLFWTAMLSGPPQAGDFVDYRPLRIWHAIRSDRSQKDMLRAILVHYRVDWKRPTFIDDVKWLLGAAEGLENARNDAIHSPLFFVERSLYGISHLGKKVAPADWLFNPRAVSLAKRADLLAEFRYCRDTAITLSDYAREMDSALLHPRRPWPGRPRLPNRGDGQGAKYQPRTKPRPPPRPSQG